MKKENHPFWCTRFGLKLEVMIPFVLAYGGGSSGAFEQGFFAAILLAVLNTAFERLLCSAQERMKRFFLSLTSGLVVVLICSRFFLSLTSGLVVVLICSGLLIWWKLGGTLVNPIAYFGSGRTSLAIGSLIVSWRLALLMADESLGRRENRRRETRSEGTRE